MPKLYDPESRDECPECDADLILMNYRGVMAGCPECIPDGLVDAYTAGGVTNAR